MDNKMKAVIAGVIGLVVMTTVIFSLNGKSTPAALAENFIKTVKDWATAVETAENKEEIKDATKEAISEINELIPKAIVDLSSYVEGYGGFAELSKPSNSAAMIGEFQSTIKEWEDLERRLNNISPEIVDKNQKIISTMNDKDYEEMVKFTLDAFVNMVKIISEDKKSMGAVNALAKEIALSFGNEKFTPLKKEDIDKMVSDYKKRYENISYDELVKRLRKDFRFLEDIL